MNTVKLNYRHIFDPPALTACAAEIDHELSKGVNFCIDFAGVEFIGSTFIGQLLKVARDAKTANITIYAANINAAVYDLLERTAVTKVIKVQR